MNASNAPTAMNGNSAETVKLFAVYLGGRAPKCNTELHDVVFVAGGAIEDTYEQMMDQWFGTPQDLHIDSWMDLSVVDGYRVALSPAKPEGAKKLFFVNLGAYRDGEFAETHANIVIVAERAPEAKARAKAELLKGGPSAVHTDDLYDVDGCFEVGKAGGLHITLTPTDQPASLRPNNGYHIIPKAIIANYLKRRAAASALQGEMCL